ncbi:hypothetical protein [Shinella sp.]|uniref:hypothetical protein n=1 Tax=Shinella sp. TaxID=1870904 RepID=UPI00258C2C02|nr:hypothetical protein [Shinella sp.]MCO5137492.1 hypothetical protein [Shinella sp.]
MATPSRQACHDRATPCRGHLRSLLSVEEAADAEADRFARTVEAEEADARHFAIDADQHVALPIVLPHADDLAEKHFAGFDGPVLADIGRLVAEAVEQLAPCDEAIARCFGGQLERGSGLAGMVCEIEPQHLDEGGPAGLEPLHLVVPVVR